MLMTTCRSLMCPSFDSAFGVKILLRASGAASEFALAVKARTPGGAAFRSAHVIPVPGVSDQRRMPWVDRLKHDEDRAVPDSGRWKDEQPSPRCSGERGTL